ncbi:MAG: hypothetical protein ABI222_10040, partial [Opitutaceae bacterium]
MTRPIQQARMQIEPVGRTAPQLGASTESDVRSPRNSTFTRADNDRTVLKGGHVMAKQSTSTAIDPALTLQTLKEADETILPR